MKLKILIFLQFARWSVIIEVQIEFVLFFSQLVDSFYVLSCHFCFSLSIFLSLFFLSLLYFFNSLFLPICGTGCSMFRILHFRGCTIHSLFYFLLLKRELCTLVPDNAIIHFPVHNTNGDRLFLTWPEPQHIVLDPSYCF